MPPKRKKFIDKSWKKDLFLDTLKKIKNWDFEHLNIKQLVWKKWYFRCRLWDVRIVFTKINWEIKIVSIWSRWDIYKSI